MSELLHHRSPEEMVEARKGRIVKTILTASIEKKQSLPDGLSNSVPFGWALAKEALPEFMLSLSKELNLNSDELMIYQALGGILLREELYFAYPEWRSLLVSSVLNSVFPDLNTLMANLNDKAGNHLFGVGRSLSEADKLVRHGITDHKYDRPSYEFIYLSPFKPLYHSFQIETGKKMIAPLIGLHRFVLYREGRLERHAHELFEDKDRSVSTWIVDQMRVALLS